MIPDELSDGPQAAEEAREADTRRKELADDLLSIIRTVSGRRVIYDILTQMGAWDAVYSARGAGRQEAAFELIARIKGVERKFWHLMLEENEK